ncbi:MAG TPA: hypothetical protein VKE96_00825 [Vicinamibacterales bacterium]|nr:hypothetical protein [Vicinamibacterales bacterium]
MADSDEVSGAIAPGAADLARAFRAQAPELAGHQQAESVHVGPSGLTVLCSANPTGGGELTRLLRLSDGGDVVWERHFGSEHGAGRAMAALPNGSFAIAGDVRRGELEYQAQLLRVDSEGRVLASRSCGPRGVTGFSAVTALDDGSTIAGGMAEGRGWILCVDESLNLLWERPLGDADTVCGLASLSGRSFAVASANQSTTGLGTAQLAMFTADQQVRWQQRLPASGRGEPAALAARAGSRSLVMIGHRSANEADPARCWVACVDADGRLMWERLIGEADEARRGRGVAVLDDEGVAVAGDGLRRRGRALHVARLAGDGALAWERSYGGGEGAQAVARGIASAADGGFVVVGSTVSKGPGRTNAWVIRLDDDGEMLWDRVFGCAR